MNKENIKRMFPHIYNIWHEFRVNQNKLADEKKKKAYDQYGIEILRDLFSMVIAKGYNVSCYYGTLLGLIRDDQLIPWDDDLDFIILDIDSFSWEKFEQDMNSAGFWKYRTIENDKGISGQSYKKKDVLCDFTLKEAGNGIVECPYGGYQIPGTHYENGKTALYQYWNCMVPQTGKLIDKIAGGVNIKIPENYESVLTAYYGENWRTPDPDFKPPRNSVELPAKITYFKKGIF